MPSTVDRVLPWRRSSPPPAEEVAPLLTAFRTRHGRTARTDLITRAYLSASAAHQGQARQTGEAYIHHPIAVAQLSPALPPGFCFYFDSCLRRSSVR